MKKGCKLISILTGLCLCLMLMISTAWAGGSNSPEQVARKFVQAYFTLDKSMGSYLSQSARFNADQMDMVDLYLEIKAADAVNQGYDISYFKMQPIQMKAIVLDQDENSAKIRFEVSAIRSINPLFRAIGFVFGLLDEHRSSDVFTLVKEEGEWKIGPGAFDLPVPI